MWARGGKLPCNVARSRDTTPLKSYALSICYEGQGLEYPEGGAMAFFTSFSKGLYPGEVVLLILGIVLFVVLVIAFFYQLTHQRSIAALLGFFIPPW